MNLLHKLFYVGEIYGNRTIMANIVDLSFIGVGGIMLSMFMPPEQRTLFVWVLTLVCGYLVARAVIRGYIKHRIIKSRQYSVGLSTVATRFSRSSVQDELNNADTVRLIVDTDIYKLFDATFNFYRQTKNGEFLSRQAYYTVYEHKLIRPLPNLLFDSKRAKGRQYRYNYVSSQKLSLEGNFDEHFDTYAPQYYAVDTLSFISPEVMHALIDAHRYDIEIIEDRLFLYGPLLDEEQLKVIQLHGHRVAAAINDNIDNYRDSYLPAKSRESQVSPFARTLMKSPFKALITATALGLTTLVILAIAVIERSSEIAFNDYSFYVYALFVYFSLKAVKIIRANKKQHASFLAMRKYTAAQKF